MTNSNGRIIPSTDLRKMNFKSFAFQGDWENLLGNLAINFHMVVHGLPGQGKSTFCLQFARYLAKNFGVVLFLSSEEGFTKTFNDKL